MNALNPFVLPPAADPLAGLARLAARVAIYVPTTLHAEPAPAAVVNAQRTRVAAAFARWFGGYTETTAVGGYWSEMTDCLIREEVTIVYSATEPATLARVLNNVVQLARSVAAAMNQECVTLEVNGATYFVPRPAEAYDNAEAEALASVG